MSSDMTQMATAFYWVGRMVSLKGRRLEREASWARARVLMGGWVRRNSKKGDAYPCLRKPSPLPKAEFSPVFVAGDDVKQLRNKRKALRRRGER